MADTAAAMLEQIQQIARKNQDALRSEVLINDTVYPGSTIRFPDIQATVTTALSGPLKIVPRTVDGVVQIVAVNDATGSAHVLHGSAWENEFGENSKQLLGK